MRIKVLFLAPLILAACASRQSPMPTVPDVDLERFMGSWYVIANIPTFIEERAHNAVEKYTLNPDGSIHTEFTFRDGSFDGPQKRYNPTGYVVNRQTNSTWDMQFIWPFKSEFLISYLDADYTLTIIGRNKRDYVWIMARSPSIADSEYQRALDFLSVNGYDVSLVKRVPQKAGP